VTDSAKAERITYSSEKLVSVGLVSMPSRSQHVD